ncbi:type II toxin-antitoxin system RelE/ParE family toxin [Labrenzia aggregata]|uniref:Type II toxin-antitoxin system RelE/ParE family toxin n=1 Tax=Roseibium aggregatum TaxID=187304 RepID=A0A926P4E9_9HYPH|nr:type II toxin-antitoxin system RelE/ParE family toxin [Roseibium aggregatum]
MQKWFLEQIQYIAERNPQAAQDIVDRMRLLRERLGDYPRLGSIGTIPGTRKVVLKPYVLTTREFGNACEVVGIRHVRQKHGIRPQINLPQPDHYADDNDGGTEMDGP